MMKADLKYFIWVLGLGMALTAYAYTNFTGKSDFSRLEKKVDRIINFLMKKNMRKQQ